MFLKQKIKEKLFKNKLIYNIYRFLIIKKKEFFLERKDKKKKLVNVSEDLNTYIVDTRISTFRWDSVMGLIRASNFFYNEKWSIIIFEDASLRYHEKEISHETYTNNLINIFFQAILILPNPPISVKIINNHYELLKIVKTSKKIFPKNLSLHGVTQGPKWYLARDFDKEDFVNFKKNQPILKASQYHSKIFENYLNYRNINEYITITIRTKSWEKQYWNTTLQDMKLYLDFINKHNLKKHDVLILPDTEKDVPKEIVSFIENNKLKYHIFNHGSFSVPMRFLAYSKSKFNFSHSNGPTILLFFIENNTFNIQKDPSQSEDNNFFIKRLNDEIFKNKIYINFKKHINR